MTDKTDALAALDVAIASATGSRVTLHLTRAKQLREALAAPAASVDVAALRAIADGIDPATGTMGCKEVADLLRKLIDSAGGAKCTGADCKPRDGGTLCQSCGGDITPQPAKDDAAVADALMVVNDAANDARHAGDYAKANALVRARVTLYRASARPAATAAVPDGWKLVPIVATPSMDAAGKESLSDNGVADVHDADALVCFAAMLAAAPAAPKGVDGAIRRAYQAAFLRQGHSDDLLASLERDVDAAIAAQQAEGEDRG